MKKLLLILSLALIGCSAEEETVTLEEFEYIVSLQEECQSGSINEVYVREEVYSRIYKNHELNDCEEVHDIPDLQEVWHEGYLAGLSTTNPQYQ